MKLINQFKIGASAAAATTFLAILLSVREQLVAVGPWVLGALLASSTAALAYGGVRVWVSGRKHWLTLRAQSLEVRTQEQQFIHEGKRNELELLGIRADIHVKLSRLYADPNGNYPVLLPGTFVSPAEIGNNLLMLPPGQVRPAGQRLLSAGAQPEPVQPLQIPIASSFRAVMSYIQPEVIVDGEVKRESQVVLACDHQGVVLGKVGDWLSTLVVGMPGMGKSTALYFFISQLMVLASRFQVLDPHASLASLRNLLPYVNRVDACVQCAPLIEEELERRIDRYEENDGVCMDPHYMLIVDELPVIADHEQQLSKAKQQFRSLIDVLRRVVCEGRKYKMYCMVVGQSIPATVLPTIARDNMSSRYVFNCSAAHARMAGLDSKVIEALLPALENEVGRCIVKPARMKAFLGAIPETGVNDLRYVIEKTNYQRKGWDTEEDPDNMEDLQPKDEVPMQDLELARGIEAYIAGAKTLDAFCVAMGYQNTNQGRFLWARVKAAAAA